MTMFYSRWHELIQILVVRNLKIRYKGSALGFFWSLLTPGLTILMYAVFAKILKFRVKQAFRTSVPYFSICSLICSKRVFRLTSKTFPYIFRRKPPTSAGSVSS